MTAEISDFVGVTGNRDKLVSIFQFTPFVIENFVKGAGFPKLAKSLVHVGDAMDRYRAVTRLSGLFDSLTTRKWKELSEIADPLKKYLSFAQYILSTMFFPFDNLALLSKIGAIAPEHAARFGPCAVFFLFWNQFLNTLIQIIKLREMWEDRENPATGKTRPEFKKVILTWLKSACLCVFAMALLPKGGPKLITSRRNPLYVLQGLMTLLTPPSLPISIPARSTFALTACICDLYMAIY